MIEDGHELSDLLRVAATFLNLEPQTNSDADLMVNAADWIDAQFLLGDIRTSELNGLNRRYRERVVEVVQLRAKLEQVKEILKSKEQNEINIHNTNHSNGRANLCARSTK